MPNLKVDIANYITEIIIDKLLLNKKVERPNFAFWKKEYNDKLPELTETYVYELTQVKKLLKVFCGKVLIDKFKDGTIHTLRYMTKEDSKDLIFELFKNQITYISSLDISKKELERVVDKVNYIESRPTGNKKLAKGL